jgi:hypothetical protein
LSWGAIAEALFFLTSALLVTVITIFVFAASLLGRAVEAKAKDEEELRKTGERELDLKITEAQKALNELKEAGLKDNSNSEKALVAVLTAEASKATYNRESKRILRAYSVFTVWGGVIYPAIFFISSIVSSIIAWSLAATNSNIFLIGDYTFLSIPFQIGFIIVSLLLLGVGIKQLIFSLDNIQKVAITSEEIWLKKIIEGYKIAQQEIDNRKQVILSLTTESDQYPIQVLAGQKNSLPIKINIVQGTSAHKVQVDVMCPDKGFSLELSNNFIDIQTRTQKWWHHDIKEQYEQYIGIRALLNSDIRRRINYLGKIIITTPTVLGTYPLIYSVSSEECAAEDHIRYIKVVKEIEPGEPGDVELDEIPF